MVDESLLGIAQSTRIQNQVERILSSVRRHLQMDVGFVSEFRNEQRVFRFVDREPGIPVDSGEGGPLAESYCYHIVEGRVPEVLEDAKTHPITSAIAATHEIPVGAHISVPIRLLNGSLFGTFCFFSREPNYLLGGKELEVVRVCADLVSGLIEDAVSVGTELIEKKQRIERILEKRDLSIVFQPIYRLSDNRLMSFEALSRFPGPPFQSPDVWFRDAAEVGRGAELEIMAVEEALKTLRALPESASLSVNLSPAAILSTAFPDLFDHRLCRRLIVELTEHDPVSDYGALKTRLAHYRRKGMRLAIDDVGAGHAIFRHILDLGPDLIKLDIALTRNIDTDVARQTLAEAIAMFGRKMGCDVIAEGVETLQELDALRAIGATKAQGYLMSRPVSLMDAAKLPAIFECGRPFDERFTAGSRSSKPALLL